MQPSAQSARPAQRPKERFPCRLPNCTKTFSRACVVPRHLISVQDVPELADLPSRRPRYRPVTCAECGKRLSRCDSLPRHRAARHPELLQVPVQGVPKEDSPVPSGSGSGQRAPSKAENGAADPLGDAVGNDPETTGAQTMGAWTPTLAEWEAIFLEWAAMQRGDRAAQARTT